MTLFLMMPLGPWLLGATEHNIISNKKLIVTIKGINQPNIKLFLIVIVIKWGPGVYPVKLFTTTINTVVFLSLNLVQNLLVRLVWAQV